MKAISAIWLFIDVLLLTGYFAQGQKKCESADDACVRDYDCKSRQYVCGNHNCCRLLGKNDGKAGEECSHRSDCKEGLQCVGRGEKFVVKGKCMTLFAKKNDFCIDNTMCKAGLYCDTKKKKCKKLKELGKKCKSSDECNNSHCLPSVFSTSQRQGQLEGKVSQYKSYCAVRSRKQGQRCQPKRNHCKKKQICTMKRGRGFGGGGFRGGGFRGGRFDIYSRTKRQAKGRRGRKNGRKNRKIEVRRGVYTCENMDLGLGTELPCEVSAECPCGEGCFNLRRNTWALRTFPDQQPNLTNLPAFGQNKKPGRCRRADCSTTDCRDFGFQPNYVCRDEKVCFPPQRVMFRVYGQQPAIDELGGRGFGPTRGLVGGVGYDAYNYLR